VRSLIARAVCVVALASAFARPAGAAPGQHYMLGAGGLSCETWLQQRADPDPHKSTSSAFLLWVEGWLSRSTMINGYPNLLLGVAPEALGAWLDGYCHANPSDNLARATAQLELALIQKAQAGK
jgi:hypothetical protein